jgi:hypothetical protein
VKPDKRFELWARSTGEEAPSLRATGEEWTLRSEAARLASASGDEGVMSVWVQDAAGKVVWSAGEKAEALAGVKD